MNDLVDGIDTSMTAQQFADLSKDKSKLFIVSMIDRPGSSVFASDLEYNHFPPGTPLNDAYQFYIKKWEELTWVIIQVPMIYKELVWEIAERHGMRVADGIPMILSNKGRVSFPLQGDNVFTLENKSGSRVYEGAAARKELLRQEKAEVDQIISDHMNAMGEMCPNCGCLHNETYEKKHPKQARALRAICKKFDPKAPCKLCGHPVERLSQGGPNICAWCDCGYESEIPPDLRHEYWRFRPEVPYEEANQT